MEHDKIAKVSDAMGMQVRCTLCGAAPYKKCRNERYQENEVVHVARLDNYVRIHMKD